MQITSAQGVRDAALAAMPGDPKEVESWGGVDLERVIENVKPTILIGVSATPGTFCESVVRKMAEVNERPMIFPLSNPTSKCECTAEEAISWSDGRAIVATGSPFPPMTFNGRRYRIGQGNNAFIFPGVGLGVTVARATHVSDGMFLDAAKALAEHVSQADLDESAVYPHLTTIRECSHAVAVAVIKRAVREGHAAPMENIEEAVRKAMWFPDYMPVRYEAAARTETAAKVSS